MPPAPLTSDRSLGDVGRATLSIGLPLVMLAGLVFWATHGTVPILTVARVGLAVAITQVFPGVVLWRLIRPRGGWVVEDLAFGFALGSLLAMVFQLPAGLSGQRWLSGVLCLAVAGVVLLIPATRRRVLRAQVSALPWWWGGAVALPSLLSVPLMRQYFDQNPISWSGGGFRAMDIDTQLHLSLVGQLLQRGPTRFPWVESEPLGYHYLSHAWVAQVSATSGADIPQVLLRIMPAMFPVIIALTVGAAALRLTRTPWAGAAAASVLFAVGRANPVGSGMSLSPLTPYSPSVAPSVGLLVVLLVLLVLRWRGEIPRLITLPVVFALSVGAAGAKGSTTPLIVAGIGLALGALLLFDRTRWKALLLDLVVVVAGLETAIKLIFHGSGEGLHLSIPDSAAQTWVAHMAGASGGTAFDLVASAAAIVTTMTAGILVLLFVCYRDLRAKPEWWLFAGGVLAGSIAVGVFAHPGLSQYYFAVSAKPVMALGSSVMLVELIRRTSASDLRRTVVISVAGAFSLAWVVPAVFLGPAHRRDIVICLGVGLIIVLLAGVVAVVVASSQRVTLGVAAVALTMLAAGAVAGGQGSLVRYKAYGAVGRTSTSAVSMEMIQAAVYIRDHSNREDVVATNMHCITITVDPLNGCDNRWMFVAAYSERQVLVEGWTATPQAAALAPTGRDLMSAPYWHPDLLQLNDRFIAAPTAAAERALWQRGVRWIFADHRRPWSVDLARFADLRLANRDVNVYQLRPPA